MKTLTAFVLLLLFPFISVYAGEADVIEVNIVNLADGAYRFDVTLSHADEGW
jgi:hypothetical protein